MEKTPNKESFELTATRFNTKEYQLQRKNHFDIQFLKTEDNATSILDDNMRYMVVSFPLPKETTEATDVSFFNQTIKTAGKTTFETSTLVLRDAIYYDTESRFLEWRKKVYDPENGTMGIAAEYKQNAVVREYSPNGDEFRAWKLIGCWPSSIDNGELSYEDGGEKQISVGITYDYAYRTTSYAG